MNKTVDFIDLGRIDYKKCWEYQDVLFSEILQSYEIDCKVIDYLGHSDARNKKNKQSQQSLYKKFFKYISSINRRRELTIFQGYFP